ncbi:MAG: hypothetical protein A2Y24_05965 [Clostridiales bacterium GWE2_32_10]|nr:MAG: hypothetical protein A2Y24_05965 [Clostridiales bacterium GWE2_32_10]
MKLTRILEFYSEVNKLKSTLRYNGYDVAFRESTADHSWRLALMCMDLYEDLKIDINIVSAIKIALVHDLCEYKDDTDIDAYDVKAGKISKEQKHLIEDNVISNLVIEYGKQYIYDLWLEYENQESRESKYVKALDKIETTLHMIDRGGEIINFEHTAVYCDKSVENFKELKPLLKEVKSKLKEYYNLKGYEWKNEWNM